MKRKIAAQLGLITYETEWKHYVCDTRERYVSTGQCVHCSKHRKKDLPNPKRLYPPEQTPETRDQALQMDSKFYKPTKPCKRGHLAKRYTRSSICVMCNRMAAAKTINATPDRVKRAAGLVLVRVWVYLDQVDEVSALERDLLSRRNRESPAKPPIPILPGGDRHPDDYEMK